MHIISESMLMLLTENCQNRSMTVEAGQSWRVFFETQCIILIAQEMVKIFDRGKHVTCQNWLI